MSEVRDLISSLDDRFVGIKSAYGKSEQLISDISRPLNAESRENEKYCLVINGSVARKELTDSSDFDAFLISDGQLDSRQLESAEKFWLSAKEGSGLGDPGGSGTFSGDQVLDLNEMVQNIGGLDDDNNKITQRMLVILESVPIGNVLIYNRLRDKLIERYISDQITNHQLGLFLLNDIIRYYRTICIDFEFKTTEQKKAWGLRNIKLVYSRKLIYFAGIVMCAEMAQQSYKEKRCLFKFMMDMTPIERLIYVFGTDIYKSLLIYNSFLNKISDSNVREALNEVDSGARTESEVFTKLKNDGHHFSWSLRSAFMNHYDSTHPIHKAIMF